MIHSPQKTTELAVLATISHAQRFYQRGTASANLLQKQCTNRSVQSEHDFFLSPCSSNLYILLYTCRPQIQGEKAKLAITDISWNGDIWQRPCSDLWFHAFTRIDFGYTVTREQIQPLLVALMDIVGTGEFGCAPRVEESRSPPP